MTSAENIIRIGDYISLKILAYNSYLSAEGILVEDVYAEDTLESFEDHIFQIYTQMQYSASNEYEEFVQNFNGDISTVHETTTLKHIQSLKRGKDNEKALNDMFFAQKIGNSVQFGDIIQLRHSRSGKFVTVLSNELAREERENTRVGLSAEGTALSWLRVLPRFKIDRMGAYIAGGTEVLLRVPERPNEFLRCADRLSVLLENTREINSAIETGTAFRINVYMKCTDVARDSLLLTGQLISITDPETKAYLTVFQTPPVIDTVDPMDFIDSENNLMNYNNNHLLDNDNNSENNSENYHTHSSTSKDDDTVSISSLDEYLNEYGDIVLQPVKLDKFDSNAIWILETPTINTAGPISWKSDKLLIRHLNTGKYLTVQLKENHIGDDHHHQHHDDLIDNNEIDIKQLQMTHHVYDHGYGGGGHKGSHAVLTLSKGYNINQEHHKGPINLFALHEVHSGGHHLLENSKAVTISTFNNRVYFAREEFHDQYRIFPCKCVKSKSKGVSLVIKRYEGVGIIKGVTKKNDIDIDDGSNIGAVTKRGCLDIYVGLSCKKAINNCLSIIQIPKSQLTINTMFTVFPSETVQAATEALNSFLYTMNCIIMYINGFPIAQNEEQIRKINADSDARIIRQNMFREQGTMEVLLRLLNKLIPISFLLSSSNIKFDDTTGVLAIGKKIITVCLKLLLRTIADHAINQMYAADFLTILLAHVGNDMIAASCISEMLSINLELQELKISPKEINVFISRLRESEMNPMFLVLLQACSACKGHGNMKNQNDVSTYVFNKSNNDIIFNLFVNYQNITKVDWMNINSSFQLYAPPFLLKNDGEILLNEEKHEEIYCLELYKKGLPTIAANWTWPGNTKLEPMSAYGTDHVNIIEMFKSGTSPLDEMASNVTFDIRNSFSSSPNKNTLKMSEIIKSKIAIKNNISEFFIGQLFLAAELCLDRNYTVISMLEKRYPLDILISFIKYNCSNLLKGAAARLIMTLHVDRHPQLSINLPRLTRTYSQVENGSKSLTNGNTSSSILDIEMKNPYSFMLLQLLISENLRQIKGRPFGNYTVYIVELLQRLLKFNFYNTIDKLKDVISPIMDALNRKSIDFELSDVSGSLIQRRMSVKSKSLKGKSKIQRTQEAQKEKKSLDDSLDNSGFDDKNDNSKNNKDNDSIILYPDSWQLKLFDNLESIGFIAFILGLTFASVGIAIYQFIYPKTHGIAYDIFSYILTVIFTLELSLRGYCYQYTRGEIKNFIRSPLNIIDIVVVSLDYVIYSTGPLLGNAKGFTRALRLLRLARLFRIAKAARMIDAVATTVGIKLYPDWIEPDRYIKTSSTEMSTLVKLVDVLSIIQQYVDDRNISLLLDVFHQWCSGTTNKSPSELFEYITSTRCTELRVSNENYDDILIDVLLYQYNPLTQSVLDVLMQHHSCKLNLLNNMKNIQLLMSTNKENQFKKIEYIILTLRKHVDTQELWTKLLSEEHQLINNETHKYLEDLAHVCRKRCKVLIFDEDYEPEVTVQDMLRNLGCFEVCMRLHRLLPDLDSGSGITEGLRNVRNLLTSCNNLLYWFMRGNLINQQLGYDKLKYFMNSIDYRIGSHRVIKAIFENNMYLMKLCPKVYISDFVSKILNNGRFPQYLSLLSSVTSTSNDSVVANQYEIVKLLSSPENSKRIIMYFCSKSHPDYQKKIKLMQPYLNKKDITIDDCPSDLAYHLELMATLTGCTVGRKNITTVEAKVQSLFHFVDVVEAMLDNNTLLFVRIKLGLFFYNAMIDVEMKLPSLKDAACVWKLLNSFQEIFLLAKDDLRQIEKNGWDAISSNRQKVEYLIVCAMIVTGYFRLYYDVSVYRQDILASHVKRVHLTETQGNTLMNSLFIKIKLLYEMQSPLLSKNHQTILYDALVALNNSATTKFISTIENIHEYKGFYETEMKSTEKHYENKFEEFCELLLSDENILKLSNNEIQGLITKIEKLPLVSLNHEADVRYEAVMKKFVKHIMSCVVVVLHGDETSKEMEPRATKTASWIIRMFTTMIENRWNMTVAERDENGGEEEDNKVESLMITFRAIGVMPMCLNLMSKGIDPNLQLEAINLATAMVLKDGGAQEVQTIAYEYLSNKGSELFFEQSRTIFQYLISWHQIQGIIILKNDEEPELPKQLCLLRFLQLLCEGHFKDNQNVLREQPKCNSSINLLDDMVLYLSVLDKIPCRTSSNAAIKISSLILEVIQGPCELNQDYFALNTPLIETLNRNLRSQVTHDCIHSEQVELKKTTIDIFQALLEGQGNKKAVYERVLSVIHIDVVHMMSDPVKAKEEEEAELHTFDDDVDIDEENNNNEKEKEEIEIEQKAVVFAEEDLELQTESLVLLQMLCNYRPSLREELELTENIDNNDSNGESNQQVASIELIWRGELQRRFFRIPLCCKYLAKSTKDTFIENVDRSSIENKLLALLSESKEMYREIQHQKRINSWGMNYIFSKTMQDRLTWCSFYIVVLINVLMVAFYSSKILLCPNIDPSSLVDCTTDDMLQSYVHVQNNNNNYNINSLFSNTTTIIESFGLLKLRNHDDHKRYLKEGEILPLTDDCSISQGLCSYITINDGALITIEVLRYLLLLLNVCTVSMVMTVTVPVRFDRCKENGQTNTIAFFNSIMDPATIYYLLYLVLVIFTTQSPIFYAVLLLDIISKDTTTRDVVNSLWYPRRQLVITFLLCYIVFFIFSVILFLFYSDENNFPMDKDINLWIMFKTLVVYAPDGNETGNITNNRGFRGIPDISLFIILFVLFEMTKGIVIDAFSTLREIKNSRTQDTENVCFICGISKVIFERQIDRTAFDTHVKNYHHLWNYLYFIIYLWEQDKDDDDGLEHDIRLCIENNDISWFPMNKAMQLQHVIIDGETNTVEQCFYKQLDNMELKFQNNINNLGNYVSKSIERITRIVETTHAMNAPKRTGNRSRMSQGLQDSSPLTHHSRHLHSSNNHHNNDHTNHNSTHHSPHDLNKDNNHNNHKNNSVDINMVYNNQTIISKLPEVVRNNSLIRRDVFVANSLFLEQEQYINIVIDNIIGLELEEKLYMHVACRIITPKHIFDIPATDYQFNKCNKFNDDNSSINDDINSNIDLDDDIELYDVNIKSEFESDLSFKAITQSRDIILITESDLIKEDFDTKHLPITIQIILKEHENCKYSKLLGVINFELKELMKQFQNIKLLEKQFLEIDNNNNNNNSNNYNTSDSLPNMLHTHQNKFPLNNNNTIVAHATGIEIINYLLSGDKIPLEMTFKQKNAICNDCILKANFYNHQKYI